MSKFACSLQVYFQFSLQWEMLDGALGVRYGSEKKDMILIQRSLGPKSNPCGILVPQPGIEPWAVGSESAGS